MTTDITEVALITKIKNQLKNFDTVVLKEGEALALVEALENSESRLHEVAVACATAEQALEKAQQRISELESRTVTVKLPTTIEPTAFSPWVAKAFYQFHKDTVKSCFAVFSDACAAAGIKVEAE